jgi:hypothetical protein
MKVIGRAFVAIGLSVLVGCQTGGVRPAHPSSQSTTASSGALPSGAPVPMQMMVTVRSEQPEDPRDPQPQIRSMVNLDIYYLDLGAGAVSNNKEFWKRIDEEAVGVGNRDVLEKNGIRAGIAPRSEADFFGKFFTTQPHHTRKSRVDGFHSETIKMEMETPFDRQDLFVYHKGQQQPEGRSYESGVNNLMLTFGPTPRNSSSVRITICPVVHSQRQRMEFTSRNQEVQNTVNEDDCIYDVSLTTDVPEDSFLILAPGGDAARSMSVGGSFLLKRNQTERREQVILLVPTFLRVDGKPMLMHEPLIN